MVKQLDLINEPKKPVATQQPSSSNSSTSGEQSSKICTVEELEKNLILSSKHVPTPQQQQQSQNVSRHFAFGQVRPDGFYNQGLPVSSIIHLFFYHCNVLNLDFGPVATETTAWTGTYGDGAATWLATNRSATTSGSSEDGAEGTASSYAYAPSAARHGAAAAASGATICWPERDADDAATGSYVSSDGNVTKINKQIIIFNRFIHSFIIVHAGDASTATRPQAAAALLSPPPPPAATALAPESPASRLKFGQFRLQPTFVASPATTAPPPPPSPAAAGAA